jgi:GGDEF domain-containing protein
MYNGLMNPNDRRNRRFAPSNVRAHLFQQGDLVKYVGEKLGKELNGKIGTVCARVGGEEHLIVVDFGEDQARLVDENNLARTVAKAQTEEGEREDKKKPEVQKRKGVSKRQKGADNE